MKIYFLLYKAYTVDLQNCQEPILLGMPLHEPDD